MTETLSRQLTKCLSDEEGNETAKLFHQTLKPMVWAALPILNAFSPPTRTNLRYKLSIFLLDWRDWIAERENCGRIANLIIPFLNFAIYLSEGDEIYRHHFARYIRHLQQLPLLEEEGDFKEEYWNREDKLGTNP